MCCYCWVCIFKWNCSQSKRIHWNDSWKISISWQVFKLCALKCGSGCLRHWLNWNKWKNEWHSIYFECKCAYVWSWMHVIFGIFIWCHFGYINHLSMWFSAKKQSAKHATLSLLFRHFTFFICFSSLSFYNLHLLLYRCLAGNCSAYLHFVCRHQTSTNVRLTSKFNIKIKKSVEIRLIMWPPSNVPINQHPKNE